MSEHTETVDIVSDPFRLDDKVVVITGASSGLGVEFARACAEAGADIVAAARRVDRLADTVELVHAKGREGIAVAADVSVEADCKGVVTAAVERFGRVDVLVNNAGIEDHHPASRLELDTFRRVLDVNVTACFAMAQAAAKAMPPGSSIVNVASVMGLTTMDFPSTAYTTSKAAVLGLTPHPGSAVVGPQGHPRELAAARLLPLGDDREHPDRAAGEPARPRASGSPAGAVQRAGVPRLRREQLHDRHRPGRRRGAAAHVST
jgi:hypothetical protein